MWPSQTAFYHNRSRSPKFGEKLQWPSKKAESNPMKEKFLRLNSLESTSSSTSSRSPSKEDMERLDANAPPSAKESKWFGNYQNDFQYQPQSWNPHHHHRPFDHFGQFQQNHSQTHYWPQEYQYQVPEQQQNHPHHHPNSQYWPAPQHYQYQVPYNLTKGRFEVWEMEAMASEIDQISYCSQHIVYQGSHQGQDQVYYPEESGFSKCVNSFFQWGQALVATAATAVSTTLKETTTSLITSSLNPNAQVFTPAKPAMEAPEIINPPDVYTKEIHSVEKSKTVPDELQNHENTEISSNCNNNTSSIEKQQNMVNDSEPVTPPNEPEIVLRTVNQRKCTPWFPGKNQIKVSNSDIDSDENLDGNGSSSDAESETEVDSVMGGNSPRLRLLSVCSSEDGIHFEDSSPGLSASPKYKIDQQKCSPFLKSFLAGPDDLSEEESEEDDDDEDWDKVSDENQMVCDIDLELFGLSMPTIPTIVMKTDKSTTFKDEVDHNQLISTKNQNNINKRTKICCPEGDRFPTPDFDLDYEQILKRIEEANKKWDILERKNSITEKKTKNVTFTEPLVSKIQYENPELADELREARVGDYSSAQRRADQDRYNRLLGPIFKPEHRDKIRSYIATQQSYLN